MKTQVISKSEMMASTYTILVVEDDPTWQELITHVLGKSSTPKMTNIPAASVQQALEILQTHTVDAILLDLNVMDSVGIETLVLLREQHADIPVVVFAAQEAEDVALEAIRNGAQEYLVKGKVQPDAISHYILQAIGRKKLERQEVSHERINR
ncbi:MAG: CheY-like chemotaxis protein, partial [Candidatus Omnitrophota bacterium]